MKFSDILLLSDFDMTLYWDDEIPARNIAAIERFTQQGGHFTVATGRSKPTFAAHAAEAPSNAPTILSNGALIYSYSEDKVYSVMPLDDSERSRIFELYQRYNRTATFEVEAGLELYLTDASYVISVDEYAKRHVGWLGEVAKPCAIADIPRPWLKAVFSGSPENMPELRDAALAAGLNAVLSLPTLCEIQSKGVSKGVAGRKMAEMLGKKVLVCVGDAANDLEMLAAADLAFIPENATDIVRSFGYREVCHCRDGAIADVIEALEEL